MFYSLDIIGILDEQQGLDIRDAIDVTFNEILPNEKSVVDINVIVAGYEEMGDSLGLACEEDDDEYTIYVNEQLLNNREQFLRTVIHEAVHVTQYIKKDLIHLPERKYAWKGSIIEDMEYMSRPWEIEAYKYEDELIWQFESKLHSDTSLGQNSKKCVAQSQDNSNLVHELIGLALLTFAVLFLLT